MKQLITIISLLLSVIGYSQASKDAQTYQNSLKSKYPKVMHNSYEPAGLVYIVNEKLKDTTDLLPFNHIVTYENYRYTYEVWEDSISTNAQLIKKEKLYYRPYTALGCTVFMECFATMVTFNSIDIPNDKKLHFLAGNFIGIGAGALVYKKTKNTWLATLSSVAAGSIAGLGKELVDKYTGGTCSNLDAKYTIGGAFTSAVSIKLTLHK